MWLAICHLELSFEGKIYSSLIVSAISQSHILIVSYRKGQGFVWIWNGILRIQPCLVPESMRRIFRWKLLCLEVKKTWRVHYMAGNGCVVFRFLIFYRVSLLWPSHNYLCQLDCDWLIKANWLIDANWPELMLIGLNWCLV